MAASCIYEGTVHHKRVQDASTHSKADHSFTYNAFYMYMDLDEIDTANASSPLRESLLSALSLAGVMSFQTTDYYDIKAVIKSLGAERAARLRLDEKPKTSSLLADCIRSIVEAKCGRRPEGSVRILAHPRYFGLVFNPVCVYYCFDTNENVVAVVLEVSNTPWEERHMYVLADGSEDAERVADANLMVGAGGSVLGALPHTFGPFKFDKDFHVSPFMPLNQNYMWELSAPSTGIAARAVTMEGPNNAPIFSAGYRLRRRELTGRELLKCMSHNPHMTLMTQYWIYKEAYNLVRKGATFFPHPEGAETTLSRVVDSLASIFMSGTKKPINPIANGTNTVPGPVPVTTPLVAAPAASGPYVRKGRVCVIGSGISGLSTAWLLQTQGPKGLDVVVMEKELRLGGHALTLEVMPGVKADLGFQVYNLTNYPHLTGFFTSLGVDTIESDMSLSVQLVDPTGKNLITEWASHDLFTVFPHWSNVADPRYWYMVYEVLHFNRTAPPVLTPGHPDQELSVADYLTKHKYSDLFREVYLLPTAAAIWSVPNSKIAGFPMRTLITFFTNHSLLTIGTRPQWRTPAKRSADYVAKVREQIVRSGGQIRENSAVESVRIVESADGSGDRKICVRDCTGYEDVYDSVVFACHAEQAKQMLRKGAEENTPNPTAEAVKLDLDEILSVIGGVRHRPNEIWVHTDASLMPEQRKMWASWNCLAVKGDDDKDITVSYWLNLLQDLNTDTDIFVTLNPPPYRMPDPAKVLRKLTLAHPILSYDAIKSQGLLPSIQGKLGLFFAGAWATYGFHEDGIKSGVGVAKKLAGINPPWKMNTHDPIPPIYVRILWRPLVAFLRQNVTKGSVRIIFPNGKDILCGDGTDGWCNFKPCVITIHSWVLLWRLMEDASMGLAEGFIAGEWDVSPSLTDLITVLAANQQEVKAIGAGKKTSEEGKRSENALAVWALQWLGTTKNFILHRLRPNTITGSRENIEEHYDLGNDLFSLFLDETMTYSSGLYLSEKDTLYQSQINKLDRIIANANINSNTRVLEIGCGWGSCAARALETKPGCQWVGLTISTEQLEHAKGVLSSKGLSNNASLQLLDYRLAPEVFGEQSFDAIVSIEMLEAVGHDFLPGYFDIVYRMLKPGGKASIQVIIMPDESYDEYCRTSDFIRKHIFPGGHLPCIGAIKDALPLNRKTGKRLLDVVKIDYMAKDYARTLHQWNDAWEAKKIRNFVARIFGILLEEVAILLQLLRGGVLD
eukprot:comp24195_c0_seq1/m.44384 comp24195_c0_seq1/g.44384  ORF comp24195_c0_seq1/g.44384 comp24195_c0_seq1/m.44384 type:complete len:1242 (-) comp24195_c0_seq1:1315-5040(-)